MSKSKPKKQSGIPKSRTFGVFSNLTSSFSRASLPAIKSRDDLRRHIGSPVMVDSPIDPNMSLNEGNSSLSAIMSPPSASTPSPAMVTKPVHRNPRMVYDAESQAYWTGRFVAMQDKLRNESLRGRTLPTTTTSPTEQRPRSQTSSPQTPKPVPDAGLPTSYTMACMPGVTPQHLTGETIPAIQPASDMTDEDNRIRRVFRNLEALCANRSALESMHEFQHDYARLVGKKGLLPPGSSWDDKDKYKKGWVGRIFSGSNGSGRKKGSGSS